MENQHNNQVSKELSKFRQEIDNIDNKIIKLLDKRVEIVNKVGEHKKGNNERFLIRSNREADMIKNLVKRSNKSIPKSVIVNIWRKIITCANFLEENLKIAIYNPNRVADYLYLVREYYGDFIPITNHESITNVISEIEKGETQIGIFALTRENNNNWWVHLANNDKIKIYARIPFISDEKNSYMADEVNLFAVAIKKPEKSSEDRTLLSVEVSNEFSVNRLEESLKSIDTSAKILKSVNMPQIDNITFYLIELDGFFESDDKIIKTLSESKVNPYVKVIGHYPTPI